MRKTSKWIHPNSAGHGSLKVRGEVWHAAVGLRVVTTMKLYE